MRCGNLIFNLHVMALIYTGQFKTFVFSSLNNYLKDNAYLFYSFKQANKWVLTSVRKYF